MSAEESDEFYRRNPDYQGELVVPTTWRTREMPYATLQEAADALGVRKSSLRLAHMRERDGLVTHNALAGRLRMEKIGRDWYVPRDALLAELKRRGVA